jgi:hypothetical protein
VARPGNAVLQYADRISYTSYATTLGKRGFSTFQTEYLKKSFLLEALVYIGLLENSLKTKRKLFAAKEKGNKKRAGGKSFKNYFLTIKILF